MRALFQNFRKSESGASLVEYAVALVVVTIVGGAGVIIIGDNAGKLTKAGCSTVNGAVTTAGTALPTGAAKTALGTATSC